MFTKIASMNDSSARVQMSQIAIIQDDEREEYLSFRNRLLRRVIGLVDPVMAAADNSPDIDCIVRTASIIKESISTVEFGLHNQISDLSTFEYHDNKFVKQIYQKIFDTQNDLTKTAKVFRYLGVIAKEIEEMSIRISYVDHLMGVNNNIFGIVSKQKAFDEMQHHVANSLTTINGYIKRLITQNILDESSDMEDLEREIKSYTAFKVGENKLNTAESRTNFWGETRPN